MIKKNLFFTFVSDVMEIFSISIIAVGILAFSVGDYAKQVSSLFSLGKSGIGIFTMLQLLTVAFFINGVKRIVFSEKLAKKIPVVARCIMLFALVIVVISIFSALFKWFPVDELKYWAMFLLSFGVLSAVSVLLTVIKNKKENLLMEKALENLQK